MVLRDTASLVPRRLLPQEGNKYERAAMSVRMRSRRVGMYFVNRTPWSSSDDTSENMTQNPARHDFSTSCAQAGNAALPTSKTESFGADGISWRTRHTSVIHTSGNIHYKSFDDNTFMPIKATGQKLDKLSKVGTFNRT